MHFTPTKDNTSFILGCCWAYAAVGAIEGIVAIKTNTLISLSEQELLDCESDGDCNGGYVDNGLNWVKGNKGVASQDNYRYTASKDVCRASQVLNFYKFVII